MRIPNNHFLRYAVVIAGLIFIVSLGILATPSKSQARNAGIPADASLANLIHGMKALPAAAPRATAIQDAGQVAPPPAAAPAAKPVELPEGDGKPIATEYCQMCHKLTNLTKAHKDLDDWKDTIHTMMDRGATIPDDKVDVLAAYLFKNFGPKDAASAANAPAAAPATNAPSAAPTTSAATQAPAAGSAAPASAAVVVLPDGDGKAIATENCQACHKLTNLTKAHKSLDDWKDTVQLMIDRGANVAPDQVDTLVQYLAKNFGPKDASAPAAAAPPSSTPAN